MTSAGSFRRRSSASRRHCFALEQLEPRLAMATLGLGIRVLSDVNGAPGAARTSPIKVGETFWVEVQAEDIRAQPQGVNGLALDLSWDSGNLQLLNPPTAFSPQTLAPASLLTTAFPLLRSVDAYTPAAGHTGFAEPPAGAVAIPLVPSIDNLQGGSLPSAGQGSAIGADNTTPATLGFFSQLRFRALTVSDDTPFTMKLAGAVDFADAAPFDGLDPLTNPQIRTDIQTPIQDDNRQQAITEFIEIDAVPVAPSNASLSGYVFADTNLSGTFDKTANGTPTEFVVPGVQLQLFRTGTAAAVATTTTGPDGSYFFENLPAGTYRIVETQPASYVDAGTQLGTIIAPAAAGGINPPNLAARRGVAGTNEFTQIQLRGAENGIEYNFAENMIPTKNAFRAHSIAQVSLNERMGLRTAIVRGTAAPDHINLQVTADSIVVAHNNVPRVIDRAKYDIVLVQDVTAADDVTVIGTDERETAHFTPSRAAYRTGNNFRGQNVGIVTVGNAAATTTAGSGGADRAVFRDSLQVNDALVGLLSTVSLTNGENRVARATGFDRVRAVTQSAANGPENDTAQVATVTDYVLTLIGEWDVI